MSLTAREKQAGRRFRDQAQADLTASFADPPTYTVPNVLALYRHSCPGRDGRSTALELKEVYLLSPAYPDLDVPAGRFGFIYRKGRCRSCGHTGRSHTGRLVDGWQRPPITGRVNRS